MGLRAPAWVALVAVLASGPAARAAGPASSSSAPTTGESPAAPTSSAVEEAAEHFRKARALYQNGSYREAIDELEQAHSLDPTAKDLVFNLSLVSEKLGRIDDALRYMHSYSEMDLDANERARAEAAIKRLEGARREVPPTPAPTTAPAPAPAPVAPPPSPAHGRVDALTIGAAALAVVGFGVGTVFAVKASADKPAAGTVTEGPGSYDQLAQQADTAHKEAIVADVGFAAGVVFTVGAAILYFGRTRDPDAKAAPARGALEIAPSPRADGRGGSLVLRGAF